MLARYGSRFVEVAGPGAWLGHFRGEVLLAELLLGVFAAGLQAVGLEINLELRPRSLLDFDLCATRGCSRSMASARTSAGPNDGEDDAP